MVYASKAFSCLAIYQVLKEEDIACDVVSGGELFTALKGAWSQRKLSSMEIIKPLKNYVMLWITK